MKLSLLARTDTEQTQMFYELWSYSAVISGVIGLYLQVVGLMNELERIWKETVVA
jgi:hypothetical protein